MRKGFTLLEMVLVVVLVAALAVFAVPNMRSFWEKTLLVRAAGDAAALMRYAQSRAIVRQCRVRLDLEEADQSYRIALVQDEQAVLQDGQQKVIPGRWGRVFRVPSGVICALSANPLHFYPNGKMDKGRMEFCRGEQCMIVSTQEQRNRVMVMEGWVE